MIPVVSSNLAAIGYDEENQYLEILFHTGSRYGYNNVPSSVYQSLAAAPSKGSFHHQYLKDKFQYKQLK